MGSFSDIKLDYSTSVVDEKFTLSIVSRSDVDFMCIRKIGEKPKNLDDGGYIFSGNSKLIDDSVIGGIEYYYHFEYSDGVTCDIGPIKVCPPVVKIDTSVLPDSVLICFIAPLNCDYTAVFRIDSDGEKIYVEDIAGSGLKSLTDADVKNNNSYKYGFEVHYGEDTSDMAMVEVSFISHSCFPSIDVKKNGNSFIFTGYHEKGYDLYISKKLLNLKNYEYWPELEKKVSPIDSSEVSDRELVVDFPTNYVGYVYPISKIGDVCSVREPYRVSTLEEVSDIDITNNADNTSISLTLPDGSIGIQLMYGIDSFPEISRESEALKSTFISRDRIIYDRGVVTFNEPADRLFLKIYTVYPDNQFSEGISQVIVRRFS